jgi:hypothetical protein
MRNSFKIHPLCTGQRSREFRARSFKASAAREHVKRRTPLLSRLVNEPRSKQVYQSDLTARGRDCLVMRQSTMLQHPALAYQPAYGAAMNLKDFGNFALALALIDHLQGRCLLLGR